jgi:hypothetical protein
MEIPTIDPAKPIRLMCAVPVPDGTILDEGGVTTVEIRALERVAATVICSGTGSGGPDFTGARNALRRWAHASGETGTGEFRELYLSCDGPRANWVVEVQMGLT